MVYKGRMRETNTPHTDNKPLLNPVLESNILKQAQTMHTTGDTLVVSNLPNNGYEELLEGTAFKLLDVHLRLVQRLHGMPAELVNLTTEEAAIFLRCSKKALEAQRVSGEGVAYIKHNQRVFYQLSTLLTYREQNQRVNTCAESLSIKGEQNNTPTN